MKILLGSKSPRRQELLRGAGINYTLVNIECDEDFSDDLAKETVAEFLAIKKSNAYKKTLTNSILITADTTVLIEGEILNKPKDENDARLMLQKLSGKMHQVITGVCLRNENTINSFTDITNVYFNDLNKNEIEFYVDNFKPMDKAGAYGIQDWIGFIGVKKIEGDYFNVMGLPINRVYYEIQKINK